MKHCLQAVVFIFICSSVQAQSARFSGQLLPHHSEAEFIRNIDGFKKKIVVDSLRKFQSTFDHLKPGIYSIGDLFYVYLEPGFDLRMNISLDSTYGFSGKGAEENNMSVKVHNEFSSVLPSSPYLFYYEVLNMDVDEFLFKKNAFVEKQTKRMDSLSNKHFSELLKKDLDFYLRNRVFEFRNRYGTDSVKFEKFIEMISSRTYSDSALRVAGKAMRTKALNDSQKALLDSIIFDNFPPEDEYLFRNSASYRTMMDLKLSHENTLVKKSAEIKADRGELLTFTANKVKNTFIRSYLIRDVAVKLMTDFMSTPEERVVTYAKFNAIDRIEASHKKEVDDTYKNFQLFSERKPAPSFEYNELSGKKVSLSQLRGKYVYIDVWATWCGPCKAEIPFLIKIEEEFRSRNIHFVSISVDNPRDHQKWKDFVVKKNLSGLQLIADNSFESEFMKKFNITSIPRFILIDPEGLIVSADANRPSSNKLREQLNSILK